MDRLRVDLDARSYDIVIGPKVLNNLETLLHQAASGASQVMLVTNPTVYELYGKRLSKSAFDKGRLVLGMVPDGEEYKTMKQAERLIDLAVDHH